jgi:hypothetical protein
MLAALHSGDIDEAVAIATDLHEWLVRGGSPPCVIYELREASKEPLSVAWKLQHDLATFACSFVLTMA